MSKKFLSPIKLAQGATNPATGSQGELFWNSTDLKVYVHNGTSWSPSAGGFTISDTAPTTPTPKHGDSWLDSSDGSLYARFVDVDGTGQWMQIQTNSVINTELATRMTAAESSITTLQTNDTGQASSISTLQGQMTTANSNITTLQTRATYLESKGSPYNYIINGAFDIWQRGTSFAPVTNGAFTADRWQAHSSLSPISRTIQQVALAGAISALEDVPYYFRSTINTIGTGTNIRLRYKIEGAATLAGKTVTFSWYGKQNMAGSYRVLIQQNFGTGGSTSITAYDANTTYTTSWQRYSATFVMPSVVGKTIASDSCIQIELFQADVTGNVFELTAVQLEEGAVLTAFRRNSPNIQAELAACQRYYQRYYGGVGCALSGASASATAAWFSFSFPVPLRATPAVVYSGAMNISDQYVGDYTGASVTLSNVVVNTVGGRALFSGFASLNTGRWVSPPYGVIGAGYLEASAEL